MGGAVVQLALYFASLMVFRAKGSSIYNACMFFPYLICGIAVGYIFKFFYARGYVLDSILMAFGMEAEEIPMWLQDKGINRIKGIIRTLVNFQYILHFSHKFSICLRNAPSLYKPRLDLVVFITSQTVVTIWASAWPVYPWTALILPPLSFSFRDVLLCLCGWYLSAPKLGRRIRKCSHFDCDCNQWSGSEAIPNFIVIPRLWASADSPDDPARSIRQ